MYKKLAVTGFFLLCSLLSAAAQQRDSLRLLPPSPSVEAGEPIGGVESDLVTMRRGSANNSMVREVAGFRMSPTGLTDPARNKRQSSTPAA